MNTYNALYLPPLMSSPEQHMLHNSEQGKVRTARLEMDAVVIAANLLSEEANVVENSSSATLGNSFRRNIWQLRDK